MHKEDSDTFLATRASLKTALTHLQDILDAYPRQPDLPARRALLVRGRTYLSTI